MDNTAKTILSFVYKGLIIILPLFFLPWTASRLGMDNFSKLYLLWLIVPALFLAEIYLQVRAKKIIIKKTIFDWPILFFTIAFFLSSLFSVDKFASFWGGDGAIVLPFFAWLVFVLFYYLNINFLNKDQIKSIIKLLICSYLIILTGAVLIFIGVLSNSLIFTEFFKLAAGVIEELGMYVAVMSVLLFGVLLGNKLNLVFDFPRWQKNILRLALVLSFFVLMIANLTAAWIVLLLGSALIFSVFLLIKNKQTNKEEIFKQVLKENFWPSVLIIISLLFAIFNLYTTNSQSGRNFAQNLRLDYYNSGRIAAQALKHKTFLGNGPETFDYAFSLWRNQDLNKAEFWNLRFNKSSSFFLEIIVTGGLLATLCYLFFFFVFAKANYVIIKKFRSYQSDNLFLISLLSVLAFSLFIGQFLFSGNIVLLFLFWLLSSLFVISYNGLVKADNDIIFSTKNELGLAASGAIALFLLWFIFISFGVKFWIANVYFERGASAIESGNNANAINLINKAISLNANNSNYKIALAKIYLDKAFNTLNDPKNTQVDLQAVQSDFEKSVAFGQAAVASNINSVKAYEILGRVYRDISPYLSTANDSAIDVLNKATALEPNNPVLLTEIGKLYFNASKFDEAIASFAKATSLKDDYYEAKYNLAKTYNEQGKSADALVILDDIENKYDDSLVYYEQGKANFNQQQYGKAMTKFKQVLIISPNNANALYSLASSLSALGDNQEALYYYKKVAQLNPQNTEVKKKIEELEKK